MAKATILFADNDPDFLKTRTEFLEKEGYQVIPAADPTEARRALEREGRIDLAILDIRLVDDNDDKDTSGLTLAKEAARSVPKIILTGFPSVEAARGALKPQPDGLPPAVDFLDKKEGPEALLAAIRRALSVHKEEIPSAQEIERKLAPVSFPIATQLFQDYEEVRKDATFMSRARLICVVVGAFVILSGGIGVLAGQVAVGALSAVSGIIAEALAALLTRSVKDAHRRMDQYHKELLTIYKEEKIKQDRQI